MCDCNTVQFLKIQSFLIFLKHSYFCKVLPGINQNVKFYDFSSHYDSFMQVILLNEMIPIGQATFVREASVLDISASPESTKVSSLCRDRENLPV